MDATPSPHGAPHGAPRSAPRARRSPLRAALALLPYLFAGFAFGVIAWKSEIVSWYRIQEMFRFQSFHMYGVIGSAVLVAAASVWLIKRFRARSLGGAPITFAPKTGGPTRYLLGGTLFGVGWALVGACPGPILVLIGAGLPAFGVVLVGAIGGTYLYGALRSKLPH